MPVCSLRGRSALAVLASVALLPAAARRYAPLIRCAVRTGAAPLWSSGEERSAGVAMLGTGWACKARYARVTTDEARGSDLAQPLLARG
jgi:hypothetical protein